MTRASHWIAIAALCFASLPRANAETYTECWNDWHNCPTGGPYDDYTVVLKGDQTSRLSGLNPNDAGTNPFAYFTNNPGSASNDGVINVTYNSMSDTTTVEFTSTDTTNDTINASNAATIAAAQNPHLDNPPDTVHFGFATPTGVSAPTGGFQIVDQYWSIQSSSTETRNDPIFNVSLIPNGGTGTGQFVTVFLQVSAPSQPGDPTVGQWLELPYTTSGGPTVVVNDLSPYPIQATASYYFSDTLIPLDNLNYQDFPPPGTNPSYKDGYTPPYNPSNWKSAQLTISPEPSSLILGGTGLLFGLVFVYRRRRPSIRV